MANRMAVTHTMLSSATLPCSVPSMRTRPTVVFEAIRASGRTVGLAFASSAAVFGDPLGHRAGLVADTSELLPESFYGVYKAANEGTASSDNCASEFSSSFVSCRRLSRSAAAASSYSSASRESEKHALRAS